MKNETKKKELKVTVVDYETFSQYDYIPPSAFFFKNGMGDFICLHSSNRVECQAWVDENYPPKGKYKVIASKCI